MPGLWHLDVANALIVAERRGVITPSASDLFWARLNSLPIDTDRDAIQERQSSLKTLARAQVSSALIDALIKPPLTLVYLSTPERQELPLTGELARGGDQLQ